MQIRQGPFCCRNNYFSNKLCFVGILLANHFYACIDVLKYFINLKCLRHMCRPIDKPVRLSLASAIILCFECKLCIAKTADANLTTEREYAPSAVIPI